MIAVKLELWPHGDASRATELGRMYIANDGRASAENPKLGDYRVAVCRKGSTDVPREIYTDEVQAAVPAVSSKMPKAVRAGEVKNYPRLAYNIWRLITRATLAAFPEERNPMHSHATLNADVMRGLAKLVHDRLVALGSQPGKRVDEVLTPEEIAALDWLNESVTP